jgi:hypothetical protein
MIATRDGARLAHHREQPELGVTVQSLQQREDIQILMAGFGVCAGCAASHDWLNNFQNRGSDPQIATD